MNFKRILTLLTILLLYSCQETKNEQSEQAETVLENSTEEAMESAEEAVLKDEETPLEKLEEYIRIEDYEKAESFYREKNIDLNAFIDKEQGRIFSFARRLLVNFVRGCDFKSVEFLLKQGVNTNLPSRTIGIPEWSGENLIESFDIENESQVDDYRKQGYVYEEYPIESAISCEESDIFYALIEAGATQKTSILKGAIKWSDTLLINKLTRESIVVDFVPASNDSTILKLLIPFTDGKQYGEIEYGEGGDMFDSDLMIASAAGQSALVKFMLETGADPNACLPDNSETGPDENGYYPAATALSIAKKEYERNIELSENRDDTNQFTNKARDYMEIINLLEQYGAKEIDKCLGP